MPPDPGCGSRSRLHRDPFECEVERLIVEMDLFSSHSALIGEFASLGAARLAVRDLFEKLVATLKLPQAARLQI